MAESSTSTSPSQSSTLSTSFTPTGTRDSAPGSHNDDDDDDNNNTVPGGMASYYFVFLMLTVAVIGVVVFLNFRRRRKRRLQMMYGHQPAAPAREDEQTRRRRRYWEGRWMDASSREEGLNEHGEAPPQYSPKRPSQDAQRQNGGEGGVAVPMQTLSREDAGLNGKPPEYEAGGYGDMMRPTGQQPEGGASSSQR